MADHSQKHLSMRAGQTILPQIGENRFAHRHGQRIGRVVAGFPTSDVNELTAPIKVVQAKMNNLNGADTVNRQEQNHRIIPAADRRLTVDHREHRIDLCPGQKPRTLLVPIHARRQHRASQIHRRLPTPVQVPKEVAQRVAPAAQSTSAARLRLASKKPVYHLRSQ